VGGSESFSVACLQQSIIKKQKKWKKGKNLKNFRKPPTVSNKIENENYGLTKSSG
jgi:hypothetical protein